MKREKVHFLVTATIGYNTPSERVGAIREARENLLSVRTRGVAEPKRAVLVKGKPKVRCKTL